MFEVFLDQVRRGEPHRDIKDALHAAYRAASEAATGARVARAEVRSDDHTIAVIEVMD